MSKVLKSQNPKVLKLSEVAKSLNLTYTQVYDAARSGRLWADRDHANGRYSVSQENFDRFKNLLERWRIVGGAGIPRSVDEGELPLDKDDCWAIRSWRTGGMSFYQACQKWNAAYRRPNEKQREREFQAFKKKLDKAIKESFEDMSPEGDAA